MPPRLTRYEIIQEIGSGGMSVVYRATDTQLSRQVAVKVLHDFLAKQSDAKKRFHREAVAVAKLHHRGILEIFDYSGPDAAESYIVTELIDGHTLRAFAERINGLDHPEMAALIVAEIGDALEHAHARGVIHRDIKPENVMVAKDGTVKLMDFGIAQLLDGPRVTATGALLGSPAHMAPEVIDGQRPDARADVFSLGTILYWLATGALPFDAPNPSALFKRILSGEYDDPQMVQPKIGNGLARIIRRALEVDPDARYPDAGSMVADLVAELDFVGLTPAASEAKACLQDPDGYGRALEAQLIERLTSAGRVAMADKQLASAMDALNRVLAIDPSNKEVKALMASVGKQRDLRLRAKQAAVALGIIAAAGAGGFIVGEVYELFGASRPASAGVGPTGLAGGLASATPAAIGPAGGVDRPGGAGDPELSAGAGSGEIDGAGEGPGGSVGDAPKLGDPPGSGAIGAGSSNGAGGASDGAGRSGSGGPKPGADDDGAGSSKGTGNPGAANDGAASAGSGTAASGTGARGSTNDGPSSTGSGDTKSGAAGDSKSGTAGGTKPGSAGDIKPGAQGDTKPGSGSAGDTNANTGAAPSSSASKTGGSKTGAGISGSGGNEPGAGTSGSVGTSGGTKPSGSGSQERGSDDAKTHGRLQIRIGGSFADIFVDGKRTRRDFYGGVLELPVGRHKLEVVKPGLGRYRPRILEVTERGDIVEIQNDGSARALAGELLFSIPRPSAEAPPAGWVWSS